MFRLLMGVFLVVVAFDFIGVEVDACHASMMEI